MEISEMTIMQINSRLRVMCVRNSKNTILSQLALLLSTDWLFIFHLTRFYECHMHLAFSQTKPNDDL